MHSGLIYITRQELFKELDGLDPGNFFAVADAKIKNHLPQWIQFSPQVFWLNQPEEQKTLGTYGDAVDFFLRQGIDRSSTLYAFGGGATTDFGGFVAATILRGIRWRGVPTTLLAMVDGSLGGKVAVNTPQGKNLVGAFHLPEKVYLCPDLLKTLPDEEWNSGKGELLKYGFLSQEIHRLILDKVDMGKIIEAAARFKMGVVELDLRDESERVQLNLGHTLGHAFESQLRISHGMAVAMGMRYLFEVFQKDEALAKWKEMALALSLPLEKLSLEAYPRFDRKLFWDYLQQDKKRVRQSIRLVLADGPGKIRVEEHRLTELRNRIEAHAEFKDS